jgi:proliferating cell nuclear antigen PCNA
MIKLIINDTKEFYKSIDAIGVLINEGLFTIDKDKFYLRATDPSQISLVDFVMPKDAFEEFVFDTNDKLNFGININNLLQILSHSNSDDKLSLEIQEGKPTLLLEFIGKSKRSFTIPLIDVSDQQNPIPQIPFDVDIQLSYEQLNAGIKDAALFSSHLVFFVKDNKLILQTHSSKGEFKQEIQSGEVTINGTQAKAMFPLEYLQNMIKNAKTTITLKLKDDMPIEISYTIGKSAIRYFLAPRVDSE